MKFAEVANRLTGISTPFGGASWQPAEMEIAAARRVIAFLEDRRVLYEPEQMEVASHCVHSVIEIRHRLSDELGKLDGGSELAASLRAMRAACRKFLERVGTDGRDGIHHANGGGFHSWTFGSALGELRETRSASMLPGSLPRSSWTWRTGWPPSCPRMPTPIAATMTVCSAACTCSCPSGNPAMLRMGIRWSR